MVWRFVSAGKINGVRTSRGDIKAKKIAGTFFGICASRGKKDKQKRNKQKNKRTQSDQRKKREGKRHIQRKITST